MKSDIVRKISRVVFYSLLLAVVGGCKGNQDPSKGENTHWHDVKIQLTAYGNDWEVFAEIEPFVVGKNSTLTVHFTSLNDFKPLENGSVTASLVVGEKGVRQTLTNPTRTGVCTFVLQPETSGEGVLTFIIKTDTVESKVVMPITVFTDEHKAETAAVQAEIVHNDGVSFPKEQSWKVDFATAPPTVGKFGQVIKTTAKVQSAQGDEELIVAKTSGIVVLSGGNLALGKSVAKGENLFQITSSGLAENNLNVRLLETESNYNHAKADYERLKGLAKDKIVSQHELLEAETVYKNAKAVHDNLQRNFASGGQKVSSPMSGVIKQVYVSSGQYVDAGAPLAVVSQNKNLFLVANVSPKYAPILSLISTANIRTLSDNKTYSLEELGGKLVSYGKSAEGESYLIPVTFGIENRGHFVSGGFVDLYIKTSSNAQTMTVPNTALTEEMGNYFLYVQLTPELFEKREVTIGVTDGLSTEIKSGLQPKERIVSKGAVLVKLVSASGAVDAHAGHAH